ncbi:MAG: metal-dependent transcriptional regulator [Euryarchaeota archaeon]|nr:metal-dependent transcriptional regulator [Euryarchaeota archaeon]
MKEVREKYIERMYDLKREKGYIRSIDLARTLGVKPSSVTEMLQKLATEGYVKYERYRNVDLTEKGLALAKELERRHNAIKKLFMLIGVSEDTANKDACVIEHIISEETAKKIMEYADNLP